MPAIMDKATDNGSAVPKEEVVLAQPFKLEALLNVPGRKAIIAKAEVPEEIKHLRWGQAFGK